MSKSMMARSALASLVLAGLAFVLTFRQAPAPASEPRLALVIGNADYTGDPLATAVNDAGLVADALRAAGFEVSGAANLDQDSMRRAFWDFLSRAAQAGPRALIFVYLSGRGLQYQGENYFAPIGAAINRVGDAPTEALRVSDFTQALASMPLRARIFVLDGARENRFAQDGQPFAGGLALVDAAPGALYAFNAAPGTIAPNEPAPYGAYAKALAEMLRVRGIPIDEAFSRARLRVNELTRGAFVPWDTAKLVEPVVLLPATPHGPAPVAALSYPAFRARPIREFPAMEAYSAAIERDTLEGYEDFLAAYPDNRLAVRVRALLAARREALTWRRAIEANTPNAYWSYERRYPHGPHFADARRRLIRISAPPEPPPRFDAYDFVDVPPPPPVEYVIVDRPVIVFSKIFSDGYPPPPRPPVYFLPVQPVAFVDLAPPPAPERGSLPIPVPIPIPGAPIAPQTRCADGSTSDLRGSGVCSHHRGAATEAQRQAAPPPAAPIPANGHALPQGKELPAVARDRATPLGNAARRLPLAPPPHTRCRDRSTSDSTGSGVCSHHGGEASEAQGQAEPLPAAPIPANGHALPQGKELPAVARDRATPLGRAARPLPLAPPPQTRCRDGSTSDSKGKGACSHHGGVGS